MLENDIYTRDPYVVYMDKTLSPARHRGQAAVPNSSFLRFRQVRGRYRTASAVALAAYYSSSSYLPLSFRFPIPRHPATIFDLSLWRGDRKTSRVESAKRERERDTRERDREIVHTGRALLNWSNSVYSY